MRARCRCRCQRACVVSCLRGSHVVFIFDVMLSVGMCVRVRVPRLTKHPTRVFNASVKHRPNSRAHTHCLRNMPDYKYACDCAAACARVAREIWKCNQNTHTHTIQRTRGPSPPSPRFRRVPELKALGAGNSIFHHLPNPRLNIYRIYMPARQLGYSENTRVGRLLSIEICIPLHGWMGLGVRHRTQWACVCVR